MSRGKKSNDQLTDEIILADDRLTHSSLESKEDVAGRGEVRIQGNEE
jgi:hypothetical protein